MQLPIERARWSEVMVKPELRPGLPENDKGKHERVAQDGRALGYVSEVDAHVPIQPSR
jgi:hypothetical protein